MDNWFYGEIRLINCLLYYFPIETVLYFLPNLLNSIEKYEKFRSMDTLRISVLLNISLLLIQEDYYDKAEELIIKAENYSKLSGRFDYLAIAKVRLGICKTDNS